jgi:hypothetical protein
LAKSKTTVHKFYIVDLIRKKPKSDYIEIPAYRVDVEIAVTTTGLTSAPDVPESLFKRLEKEARTELERYETVISKEAEVLDKKIVALMATPTKENLAEAQALAQGVNQSIKNALDSAEGATQKVVEARLKKEAQGDKNLREARVRTAIKWTVGAISIAGNVAKLVATFGADVTSYLAIAKTLYELGSDVAQQIKNEAKLAKDLTDGIQAFITLRGTAMQQAAERQKITDLSGIDFKKPKEAIAKVFAKIKAAGNEVTQGKDKKAIAQDFLDFAVKAVKSKLKDAEDARKAYREHTTKTRHNTDSLSLKAGELQKAMKGAKTLKEGVEIGARCMEVKKSVSDMAAKLEKREKFLDEMQQLMKGNGLEIDDRTTLQKLAEIDKLTLATEGGTVLSTVNTIRSAITEIVKAAA